MSKPPQLPLAGGCVCGAIRYECDAPIEEMQLFACHCRDCQQVTGGPYTPVVFVPAARFRITRGSVKHHITPSALGGRHQRGFCGDCGSRLTGGEAPDVASTHIGFTASSLDDPSWFAPQVHMWVADVQPWDRIPDGVPQFRHYPPS